MKEYSCSTHLMKSSVLKLCFGFFDSKGLFTKISTCRLASNRSIPGNIISTRFKFSTKVVSKMIWVPGSTNIADCGTKPDSPLTNAMQLLLVSGSIPIDYKDAISQLCLRFTV